MTRKTEVEGVKYLSPGQWKELQSVVSHPGAQVPLSVVGCTGLERSEFLHLHSDWIDWHSDQPEDPDVPIIHLPDSEECRRGKIPRGSGTEMTVVSRDSPCPNCRESRTDGQYRTTRHSTATRNIPVPDPKAINILEWWFSRFNTIPWNSSYKTLRSESERVIGRKIGHSGLRTTFAARAANNGLKPTEIASFLGISPKTMKHPEQPYKKIIVEHADCEYFSRKDTLSFQDYLEGLHELGTASNKEISRLMDRSIDQVNSKLSWMEKEGLTEDINDAPVGSKQMWKPLAPASTLLECREGCNDSFDTRQGRSVHETIAH